jgi:hypothetical protein
MYIKSSLNQSQPIQSAQIEAFEPPDKKQSQIWEQSNRRVMMLVDLIWILFTPRNVSSICQFVSRLEILCAAIYRFPKFDGQKDICITPERIRLQKFDILRLCAIHFGHQVDDKSYF